MPRSGAGDTLFAGCRLGLATVRWATDESRQTQSRNGLEAKIRAEPEFDTRLNSHEADPGIAVSQGQALLAGADRRARSCESAMHAPPCQYIVLEWESHHWSAGWTP
jgi:hypothetical protein